MATPEARLRADVLKRLREDYPPSKSQVLIFGRPANASTGPGHPDLFGVALGHFLALELKFGPKSKPTDLQIQRIKDLRRAGAYAWAVHTTLAATKAVYQAKTGGPVPKPNDPIDFDDWFQAITNQPQQPSAEEQLDATELPDSLYPIAEVVADTAEAPPFVDIPNLNPVLQAAAEAGIDIAEPVVEQPYQDMPLHNGTDAGPEPRLDSYAALTDAIAHQTDVLKTVGDRVTELWEVCNRIEHVVRVNFNHQSGVAQEVLNLHFALDKILREIGEEPLPEPVYGEPTPMDDVLPVEDNGAIEEPKPKRGRRRRSESA